MTKREPIKIRKYVSTCITLVPLLGLLMSSAQGQQVPVVLEIADGASNATTLAAPGSQLQILGENLVFPGTACVEISPPLPIEDAPCGLSVTVGGKNAAIVLGSSTHATFILPWDVEIGPAPLVAVVEGVGESEPVDLTIQEYAPALALDIVEGGTGFLHTGGTPVTPLEPAIGGEVVLVFAYGLGNTNNDPPLGDVSSSSSLAQVSGTSRVFLQRVPEEALGISQSEGEIEAAVLFAGLSPGFINLYQVNFQLPDGQEAGNYEVVVQMSDDSGGNLARSRAAVLAVGEPPLSLSSLVNGANFAQGPIAPGTLVSAFGGGIRVSEDLALFPATEHEGLSVTFNGDAALLFHVIPSQNQINLLAPNDLLVSGVVHVAITAESGASEALEVQLTEAAPGIFPIREPHTERVFAAATLANTAWLAIPDSMSESLNLPVDCEAGQINPASYCGRPARPGDAIQIYATGLGRATPGGNPAGTVLPSDQLAPADPLYWTTMQPLVTIDSMPAEVVFSGLSPGFAGLYQVNVLIPAGVAAGDEIRLEIVMPNGSSASSLIAIQP